ncbi:DUF559 domain-containing protein [Virgisporangium aliadipatigenens]|uniref:DUF559 domain-containing protein n=1 Tax=Virgisporangium aliadipatigenens TaxID=741659 RepID=UPI001EF16C43|nr:DUF559 domain-containing protein [Virgisporangium aliadipatigenens]
MAVTRGLLTRRQLAGTRFVRLFPDVYVASGVPLDHQLLCRAAALFLRGRGAISGLSAALLHGVDLVADAQPVEVSVPGRTHLRARARLVVVRSAFVRGDVSPVRGVPVTSAVRTAFDLARRGSLTEAVVRVDALLHTGLVGVGEVADYAADRRRWPGAARVAPVLELADAGAESPMESRTRLVLVLAGLPRPVTQHVVYDGAGRFVARLDLAYPEQRLGIEYEGAHHRDARRYQVDLRRQNALRAAGWEVLRFGPGDIYRDPAGVVALVRARLRTVTEAP